MTPLAEAGRSGVVTGAAGGIGAAAHGLAARGSHLVLLDIDETRLDDVVPLLVAWGLDDEILPARHLDSVQMHFPQARTHLFPRCGHLPMLEQPEVTADLLRDFWAGH